MVKKIPNKLYITFIMLFRHLRIIIYMTLIVGMLAIGIWFTTPNYYHAYTTILIKEPDVTNPIIKDLAVSTNLKKRIKVIDSLLHSRSLLISVAKEDGLITNNMSKGKVNGIINNIKNNLSLSLVGNDLIEIRLRSKSKENISRVLQLITKKLIEEIMAPKKDSIQSSEKFLSQQLNKQRDELTLAEQKLEEFKKENINELPYLKGATMDSLRKLHSKLAESQVELEGATAEADNLRENLAKTNPVVAKLEERIIHLMSEISSLRVKYTDKHSKIKRKVTEIDRLKRERDKILKNGNVIKEEDLQNIWIMAKNFGDKSDNKVIPLLVSQIQEVQKAQAKVKRINNEIKLIKRQVVMLNSQARKFATNERYLAELERDLKVKKIIYEDLMQRQQMAVVTGALGRHQHFDQFEIIDQPKDPEGSSKRPLFIYLILGLYSGFIAGLGIILLLAFMDSSIMTTHQLVELCEEMKACRKSTIVRLPKYRMVSI